MIAVFHVEHKKVPIKHANLLFQNLDHLQFRGNRIDLKPLGLFQEGIGTTKKPTPILVVSRLLLVK